MKEDNRNKHDTCMTREMCNGTLRAVDPTKDRNAEVAEMKGVLCDCLLFTLCSQESANRNMISFSRRKVTDCLILSCFFSPQSRDREHRKSTGKQGLDSSGNLYQYDNYDEVAMDTDSETGSPGEHKPGPS